MPTDLDANAASTSRIDLTWKDNAYNETGYRISKWTGSSWQQIGSIGANQTSYSITGLAPGTTYYFDVEAYNAADVEMYITPDGGVEPLRAGGGLTRWA